MRQFRRRAYVFLCAVLSSVFCGVSADELSDLAKLEQDSNWRDLRKATIRVLDSMKADDIRAGWVWNRLCVGLVQGNAIELYDGAFDTYAVGKYAANAAFWADMKSDFIPQNGFIINNAFKRGNNRGNAGRYATCTERDRVRKLAAMAAILPKLSDSAWDGRSYDSTSKPDTIRGRFYYRLAKLLLEARSSGSSFKLQSLTDLTKIPDVDSDEGLVTSFSRPPVTPDGQPVFYKVPASWAEAANDGERLHYVVSCAEKINDRAVLRLWADFLFGQFDFLTAEWDTRQEYSKTPAMREYLYALKDNETIADLADGSRRLTLPDGFNYIEMYKKLEDYQCLGKIYASRLQFEKAAEMFEKVGLTYYVQQLRGSWGEISVMQVAPAGVELTIPYIFRNAHKVTARMYRVDSARALDNLLEDLKNQRSGGMYLWSIGARRLKDGKTRKFGHLIGKTPEKVLTFDLKPLPHHWETTEYLKFGTVEPGAFVVEFVPDGNENSRVDSMIWVTDSALTVQQGMQNGHTRFFLNDPKTGRPIADKEIKVCSYYYSYDRQSVKERDAIAVQQKSFVTDQNGVVEVPFTAFKAPAKSYVSARILYTETHPGKLTVLQCEHFNGGYGRSSQEARRTFMITDKTVYKPGDSIAFTGYVRTPSYGDERNTYAKKTVKLSFRDPQGKEAFTKEVPFDVENQCFTFEMTLPEDAMLGSWSVQEQDLRAYGRFTVEEYKKPEYLLTVIPPAKPIKAGAKMSVTLEAKYYFGAPLVNAEVSYKVYRSETAQLFPFAFVWNWLYGARYAVCSVYHENGRDLEPGFVNIGEVKILDTKAKTDASGKVVFEIDTANDCATYGAKNFEYTISAEVKDSTNRVVTGRGSVIASVNPFAVSIYTPWGFAKTGARQRVQIAACTPNGDKIKGMGTLRIFRRTLNASGVPERSGAALKTIPFVANGPEDPEFILNEEGVYELEAEVVAEDGAKVAEKATVFVVGEKKGDGLFSDYPLMVSTDKPEYRPGDVARILVNCDTPNRTVYLLSRSQRDAALQCVTLDGYSTVFEIPIRKDDQPNFFVNVMSYQNGQMLTMDKQIVVPPEKKILNVSVQPEADKVKPGVSLPVRIAVTGVDGKPVSSVVTVAVYDKSLEALRPSGIPEIRSYFWSWLRENGIHFQNNLGQYLDVWRGPHGMARNFEQAFSFPFHSTSRRRNYNAYSSRMMLGVAVKHAKAPNAPAAAGGDAMAEACMGVDGAAMMSDMACGAAPLSEEGDAAESATGVRSNFQDRTLWVGCMQLSADGKGTVTVPVPDNMTTWVVRVWGLTPDTRVGEGRTEFVVSKDLIARLELPRFMVQGDTVNAVVTINNTSDRKMGQVTTTLTAPGLLDGVHTQMVEVDANGTASYEVPLKATAVGKFTLTLSAASQSEKDALELTLPVLVRGIDKQVNACGRLDATQKSGIITLDIPEARRPETTAFALYLSPGVAKNMVELLPYLAADDSGDVFGVVNRFLPVLAAKAALSKLGITWEDAAPKKTSRDPLYAEYMQRYTLNGDAVPSFSAKDYDRVLEESLKMIHKMVNTDGGWGWFGAYREDSWADTTAYVVDALLELKAFSPEKVRGDVLENGVKWLESYARRRVAEIKEHDWVGNTDCLVARVLAKAEVPNTELMKLCYDRRAKHLAPYGYAMLALAYGKNTPEAAMLLRNLEQFLKVDDENGTAYLDIPSSCCFFWYGNENETLSAYLELLLRQDAHSVTAQKVAKYLVTNVQNSPWRNSCRSLGAAVRALASYVTASGEGKPDFSVTVMLGTEKHVYSFNARNMWENNGPALFLPAEKLTSGKQIVTLAFEGKGALYWNSMLNYFSLEEVIPPAGLEMNIQRNYYRLVQDAEATALLAGKSGTVQTERVLKYKRVQLKEGDVVESGDLIEVELISAAKNDYDYVVFQDAMPAGFEYETPVSGWRWDWSAPMYVEYKERGAKFYLRNMARGQSNAFYRIRAQLRGRVIALPPTGYGIYAPELKCNGTQQILQVK